MTLKQFKIELRATDVKYDPWGCVMEENYWYALFGRCGNNQLRIIGNYLHRLSGILDRCGKSY